MQAYISRSYVEFGPFTACEIMDFSKRGILRQGDFARSEKLSHWIPLTEFVAKINASSKSSMSGSCSTMSTTSCSTSTTSAAKKTGRRPAVAKTTTSKKSKAVA